MTVLHETFAPTRRSVNTGAVLYYTVVEPLPSPHRRQSFRVNTPYIVCRIAVKYFTRRVVDDVLLYYMRHRSFVSEPFLLAVRRNRITGKSLSKSTAAAADDGI